MDEEHRLTQSLFNRAAERVGSATRLQQRLRISSNDVLMYLQGKAIPPEAVMLRAVEIVLDELPRFRSEFSSEAWQALSLPK
jgi:hypothetical protein